MAFIQMKKTKKILRDKSDQNSGEDKPKGIGLFDHVKFIKEVQDPDYFKDLSELDLKSFNHFMILRGLSMNPVLISDMAFMFKYFDIIPSPQFYTLLIALIPKGKSYDKWIKGKKKYGKILLKLIAEKFECSLSESADYLDIIYKRKDGEKEVFDICRGFGLIDREIEKIIGGKGEEE